MAECAIVGCKPEPGASFHYLPKNPALKQIWMDFIYQHRFRPSVTAGLRICGAHFSKDCFANLFQRSMGFAKKLYLKPDAEPSIYPGSPAELRNDAATLWLKRADVACQCNSVAVREVGLQCNLPANKTRTVGTQLSKRTLIYRRSLGVQTKQSKTGAGVDAVETTPAEQFIGGLISNSEEAPPSPPSDCQPEVEEDYQCVTVVTHLLLQSLSLMEACCHHSAAEKDEDLNELTESSFLWMKTQQ